MKYFTFFTLFVMHNFYTSCRSQNKQEGINGIVKNENDITIEIIEFDSAQAPNSMVRNVKQAKNGDILVASYFGIFRYNGKSFSNISSSIISTDSSSFWDVLEDQKGNLWYGSKHSGIFRVNGKNVQQFTMKNGLASDMVLDIYEERSGNIWFGASRYDGKSFRNFGTKDGFPSNNIRLLLEDKTGKLWFCSQQEDMFVYDGKTCTVLKNNEGKTFNNVWSILEDKKGNIWFSDIEGLWRYDGISFTLVSTIGAGSLIQDKKGNIWTTGGVNQPNIVGDARLYPRVWALSRYDAKSLYNKNLTPTIIYSSKELAFARLMEAKDGSIWFGSIRNGSTSHCGVHRYDGKVVTEFRSKKSKQ